MRLRWVAAAACFRAFARSKGGAPRRSVIYLQEGLGMLKTNCVPRFVLIASVAVLCLAAAPSALAAKGTGGGGGTSATSSISLVVLNSPDGLPHWGGEV